MKQSGHLSTELIDTVYAFRSARVILTAFELGVWTALSNGEEPAAAVAERLGTDPRATDRLMNTLCALGFLRKRGGRFRNTGFTARHLVQGKPEYMGGLLHTASLWKTWGTLTDSVRTGHSVAMRSPVNEQGGEWIQGFIAAMHGRAIGSAATLVKMLDLRKVLRVLDVGGGSGAYAMALVHARRNIRAVVFDLPNVIPLTQQYIREEGLEEKIETVTGDYTTDELGSGFDLVFLSSIIHSNSPQTNELLLARSVRALNPGGTLAIVDHIMSEDRTQPLAGTLFALNMLVGTAEGDTYTKSEVDAWLHTAGIRNIRSRITPLGTTLVTGRKPS